MPDYKIYFQIYGKKMLRNVTAINEAEAKEKVRNDLTFDKVEVVEVKTEQQKAQEKLEDVINRHGGTKKDTYRDLMDQIFGGFPKI